MITESPAPSPAPDITMTPTTPPHMEGSSGLQVSSTPSHITTPHGGRRSPGVDTPTPRHIADGELKVLQDCLHRWRTEVENDVRGTVT